MTATHTPTPWGLDGSYVVAKYGPTISDCGKSPSIDRGTQRANATFIVEAVNSHASLKARIKALEGQLQIAQELFAIMVSPQDHPNTSVLHLWAQCKEIECKIRDLLQPKDSAK